MQRDSVVEAATGKWPEILVSMGIERRFLKKKHGPCPICGGSDRFRFDDIDGRGTFFCSQCGAGDGFKLLEKFKGQTFKEIIDSVRRMAFFIPEAKIKMKPKQDETERKKKYIIKVREECQRISTGDPAWLYLNRRTGLKDFRSSHMAYHPALEYRDDGDVSYHPALVGMVTDHLDKGVGLHRIYLTKDGHKAKVENPKRLITCRSMDGATIKLGKPGICLGVAEGIETALASYAMFNMPVWAAISAGGLEKFTPPLCAETVVIFADNDHSFTGQLSAYTLAKKLKQSGLNVEVKMPPDVGKDWADYIEVKHD